MSSSHGGATLETVVSGGQTGVDRAALDAAIEAGIATGGWCPRGRKAEDGEIPRRYSLRQTLSADYAVRTEWNVRDSDGTLIVTVGEPTGGTALTIEFAQQWGKPCLIVDLDDNTQTKPVVDWLKSEQIAKLNVAGPRESTCRGIYDRSFEFLQRMFDELQGDA